MLLAVDGCYRWRDQGPIDSRLKPNLALRQNSGELGQQPTLPPSHSSARGAVEPALGQAGIESLDLMSQPLHTPRFAVW